MGFHHGDDGITYTPKFSLEYAPEKKIYVDLKGIFGSSTSEASAKITMPSKYAAKEEMKFNEKAVIFAIKDNKDKHVTITTTYKDNKQSVKLASSGYKDMELKVQHSLAHAKYLAHVSFDHEFESYKAGAEVDAMLDGEAKIYIKTPIHDFKIKSVYKLKAMV